MLTGIGGHVQVSTALDLADTLSVVHQGLGTHKDQRSEKTRKGLEQKRPSVLCAALSSSHFGLLAAFSLTLEGWQEWIFSC